MGSPLGPTLANVFLCHYEMKWLNSCPIEFKPKLHKRYVDGIFVMFRSRNHAKKFVDYMNTKHLNIRFTFEIEILRKKLSKHQFLEKVHSVVFLLISRVLFR